VDVRGREEATPLHIASLGGRLDIMQWLLSHDAEVNSQFGARLLWTPLHFAAFYAHPEAVQVLLEHNADINSKGIGDTPLYKAMDNYYSTPGKPEAVDIVRRLLEHGADPNTCNHSHSTPLHCASSVGGPEVARLLLSYGANVDAEDWEGRTPFQVASSNEIAKLLLEHGAAPHP